ncbi:formyltransferase family protein [Campylobacter sp.]|uniref:formyltransferase family protein n=1 Tax=Campylobacter sp. TaxID=205 RepID=UPI002AA81998|nr:formyltransferase family protein [Campylobacter sp.]MCI7077221.1 hypothetical protein [Campylobacter sp.]
MIKVLYFCKECDIALKALKYIKKQKKYALQGCFISKTDKLKKIEKFLLKHNVKVFFKIDDLKQHFKEKEIDLFLSFTNTIILEQNILDISKKAINFHPAILPDFKGVSTSSHGIIAGIKQWGASAHYMDAGIDTGNIIKIKKFSLDDLSVKTGYNLSHYTWLVAFKILKYIVKNFDLKKDFKNYKTNGGDYYSNKLLNNIKEIDLNENSDIIKRKIMGLWYPPFECAYVKVNEEKFYLITKEILEEIFSLYEYNNPKIPMGGGTKTLQVVR